MHGYFTKSIDRLTSYGPSSDHRGNNSNNSSVERGSQEQKRDSKFDNTDTWKDWINPWYRSKELKPKLNEALTRLEKLTDDIGRA